MRKLILTIAFLGILIPAWTQDLDASLLAMVSAEVDVNLSEARLVLSAFKDVHNQTQYDMALVVMVTNQQAACAQARREFSDADGLFAFLRDNCKLHVIDLDGLDSLQYDSGLHRYSPEAVYVLNMTMSMEIKRLERLKTQLSSLGSRR
jgi:hypothetical protein